MTPPGAEYTLALGDMIHISRLYNNHIKEVCLKRNWRFFDLAAELVPTETAFRDDCHFTAEGSRQVAETLAPEIARILPLENRTRR